MIQKKELVALGSVLVTLSAMPAKYVQAETANLNIEAVLLASPIGISVTQNLHFGGIMDGGPGGTVLIRPDGTSQYTGVTKINAIETPGQFKIFGNVGPNITFSVTDPSVAVSNGLGDTMEVTNFNLLTNAGGTIFQTHVLGAPTLTVPVGATLTVDPGQAVGTYQGSVTVQAVYQ